MKNIYGIIIAGIATLSCYSCDNRKDTFIDYDNIPLLELKGAHDTIPSTFVKDSIKLGLDYKIQYNLVDEEALVIGIDKSSELDNVIVEKDNVIVSCGTEGVSLITLRVKDSFGKIASSKIELTAFRDLKPVCNLNVGKVGVLSNFEVNIDLTSSFDPDAKWGGKIVKYEYKIQNNYSVQNNLPQIRYIFDSLGQKKITVRVQDNDGVWSDEKTLYFMLQ